MIHRRSCMVPPRAALALFAAAALAASGCASVPRHGAGDVIELPELEVEATSAYVSEGSLFTESSSAGLVSDFRARHVGDVLVVKVTETSLGKSTADKTLDKESSNRLEAPTLFGYENTLMGALGRDFDPALAFETGSSKSFAGEGETTRQSSLIADIAVRVLAVGSGGRMVVAGTKQISVNHEKQKLMLAGIVRPEDVGPSNAIPSSKIADLTITYGGVGDLDNVTKQGWFQRLLDKIWPF